MIMTNPKKIVIIGGGITGLSTAYYLQKQLERDNLDYEMVLLEGSDRLGGKIHTEHKNGYVIERGPDSILKRKESAAKLAKELGLEEELVDSATGKSYVLAKGRLHQIPEGAVMGIPTQISPFLFSGLFSPIGKVRAAGDFLLPKGQPIEDQSLGTFFRRRLGDEVVENLIEPLLSGIYAGNIDDLSLMSTFPQYYHLEQKHRSLVLGLKKSMANRPAPKRKKGGMFHTLKSGLGTLIDSLGKQLNKTIIRLNTSVKQITKSENGGYDIQVENGDVIKADSVVLALPHLVIPKILPEYSFFKPFEEVPSTSVANVALAFPEEAIKEDIDGTGFVISRNSDFRITACTWTHKKWPHTTPAGKVLLRCYVGKPGDEEVVQKSDEELINIVMTDLSKTMNITSQPEFSIITRWHEAMPQYTVGHKERLQKVTQYMDKELPGIFLAGGSFEGIGVPDCIDQGVKASDLVANFLKA